jgi:3-phytase
MKKSLYLILLPLTLLACKFNNNNSMMKQTDSIVFARNETRPVTSGAGEDAADDPAIWVNPTDPEKSLIIGTNKKAGLYLYNLSGEELFFYPMGNVNNVDVRYGFKLANGRQVDLVGASNRSDNSIVLMAIDPVNLTLYEISQTRVYSALTEVYGFTFYHNKARGRYFAFVVGKDGQTEQWELLPSPDQKINLKLVRNFSFATQTEGLTADDDFGVLYAAEERNCIWKVDADPEKEAIKTKVPLSDSLNTKIVYDLEGLAIYYGEDQEGYLIASVQGNYSYALFERGGNNRYLGSFTIADKITDGAEETDGLEVTSRPMGKSYPFGILVVQDGFNYDADSLINQNFKFVAWEDIAALFDPMLRIEN